MGPTSRISPNHFTQHEYEGHDLFPWPLSQWTRWTREWLYDQTLELYSHRNRINFPSRIWNIREWCFGTDHPCAVQREFFMSGSPAVVAQWYHCIKKGNIKITVKGAKKGLNLIWLTKGNQFWDYADLRKEKRNRAMKHKWTHQGYSCTLGQSGQDRFPIFCKCKRRPRIGKIVLSKAAQSLSRETDAKCSVSMVQVEPWPFIIFLTMQVVKWHRA